MNTARKVSLSRLYYTLNIILHSLQFIGMKNAGVVGGGHTAGAYCSCKWKNEEYNHGNDTENVWFVAVDR